MESKKKINNANQKSRPDPICVVLELSFDRRVKEKKGQIFLSERQRKILKHLQTNLRITTKEYQNMFDVSERTARGHLNELVKLDLLNL